MKDFEGLEKSTVVLVPSSEKGVRQFRVHRFLLPAFAVFLLPCAAYISWVILDYQKIRAQTTELAQYQTENEQQKRQFLHLAEQIGQLKQKMSNLKESKRRLKIMVDMRANDNIPQFQGIGGSGAILLQSNYSQVTYRGLGRLMHHALDDLNNEINAQKQDMADLHEFIEDQKALLACTPSVWPTKGSLSSPFGYRISPFTGRSEFHNGIDISARVNTPIIAPANGSVTSVAWHRYTGRTLTIEHGYGMVTKYAHLQKVLVKKGQHVKRGETIALLGNTGRSTGPHLHYGVYLDGAAVDPLRYVLGQE